MNTVRSFSADLTAPATPMTAADIDAFIARAKAERAANMRAGVLKLARRLRRHLTARRPGRPRLPLSAIWVSPRA